MTKEKKDTSSIVDYLRKIRENKGGAFSVGVIKHGGSIKAIAATAARQIREVMTKRKVDIVSYQRKQLPNMFGDNALEVARAGKPPTLKRSVVEHLAARGIKVVYTKGIVDFFRIKPKVVK